MLSWGEDWVACKPIGQTCKFFSCWVCFSPPLLSFFSVNAHLSAAALPHLGEPQKKLNGVEEKLLVNRVRKSPWYDLNGAGAVCFPSCVCGHLWLLNEFHSSEPQWEAAIVSLSESDNVFVHGSAFQLAPAGIWHRNCVFALTLSVLLILHGHWHELQSLVHASFQLACPLSTLSDRSLAILVFISFLSFVSCTFLFCYPLAHKLALIYIVNILWHLSCAI